MKSDTSILVLSALAQATRLEAFRLLLKHAPDGLPAGEIADALGVPKNTMSAHLHLLSQAGLAKSNRIGVSIIYRADLKTLNDLMLFLVKDCCGGRPDMCAPLLAALAPCCPEKVLSDA